MNKIGLELNADQAIDWAVEGNHITRRGRIPGGLGLKLLREFIRLNQGKMQIISDTGYWEQYPDGQKEINSFSHESKNHPYLTGDGRQRDLKKATETIVKQAKLIVKDWTG